MSDYKYLEYRVKDRIAEVVMNRPPVNAVNLAMAREINAAYRRAKEDEDVRVVIITSAVPNIFSAGADLKEAPKTAHELRRQLEVFYYEMHELLYRMGKPVLAAVTGHCRGGGITLAVSTDMVIAAKEATMAYTEINTGTLPAMHLVHLPRQAGRHRAARLLFTGDVVTADQMCELGVVNEVVPAADVLETTRKLAAQLAEKSPLAMKLLREAFLRANDLDYRRSMESVVETMCTLRDTEDSKEARLAFAEKRKPVFKGR